MVSAGISVARTSRRNTKITTTTMPIAIASVLSTSAIEPLMNTASSEVTKIATSSGSEVCSPATTSRTAAEISSVLLVAWRSTPSPSPVWPLARSTVSFGAGPRVTRATSRRRTSSAISSASNASGVATAAVVRTYSAWRSPCSSPAGAS